MLRKKIGLLSTLVIMGLSLVGLSAPAQATSPAPLALWAIGLNSPNVLFSVNSSTGAATAVGSGTEIAGGRGAAVDLTTGLVYVMDYNCDLFTLVVATGIATPTGHKVTIPGRIVFCDAMTIGRDGVGYVSAHDSPGDPFFLSFIPSTGVTTTFYPVTTGYYAWMAFDPSNGILYGQNEGNDLYSVNPASGREARVGPFSTSDPENPLSFGVVIIGNGTFFAQERFNLSSGQTTSWSGSTINSYGGSVGDGLGLLFTTTDPYLVIPDVDPVGDSDSDPAPDPVSDSVVVPSLATTGTDARDLVSLAGGALTLLVVGAGVFFISRRKLSA